MVSAVEVLAQHQINRWTQQWGCACDGDVKCDAQHQLDALKAAGFAVIRRPAPAPIPQHWHADCLGAWSADGNQEPVSAWPENPGGRGGVALPSGEFVTVDSARRLAAALLAAADAAEAQS